MSSSAHHDGQRLTIVHVITALATGGAERQVELLAADSRHDVRVVSLYGGGVVADAIRARGIPVEILGMDGAEKLTAIPRLARLLRRHRPDVVHVHLLSAQLWGIPAARLARVPVVVSTEHSIMATTFEGRPKTRSLRLVYRALERLATHTIAVSDATAARLAAWGIPAGPRLSVINPPIDFDALAGTDRGTDDRDAADRDTVRAELGLPATATVVVAVGRLDPVKRLDQLIRALAESLRRDTHVVIVGDGPLRPDLERLATELGVSSAVHLLGPRPDVPRLLRAADVLVSPSRDETFGMAVVEALGAGLPVVYAECPALDGLHLPSERAVRIERDSDAATEQRDLAAGVAALATAGRQPVDPRLVERYGAPSTARAVDDLYQRLTTASN